MPIEVFIRSSLKIEAFYHDPWCVTSEYHYDTFRKRM